MAGGQEVLLKAGWKIKIYSDDESYGYFLCENVATALHVRSGKERYIGPFNKDRTYRITSTEGKLKYRRSRKSKDVIINELNEEIVELKSEIELTSPELAEKLSHAALVMLSRGSE